MSFATLDNLSNPQKEKKEDKSGKNPTSGNKQ